MIKSKNVVFNNDYINYGDFVGSNIVRLDLLNEHNSKREIKLMTPLLSNISAAGCLLMFAGFDNYSQLASGNHELVWDDNRIIEAVNIETNEKENITLSFAKQNGSLCLRGLTSQYLLDLGRSIRFTLNSSMLTSKAELHNIDSFNITVKMRKCLMGEKFVPENNNCEPCPPFFYSFLSDFDKPNTCYRCYGKPFYCYGGAQLTPKPGFWRNDEFSTNFLKCPNSLACLG